VHQFEPDQGHKKSIMRIAKKIGFWVFFSTLIAAFTCLLAYVAVILHTPIHATPPTLFLLIISLILTGWCVMYIATEYVGGNIKY
jgi:heme/copper-type cytochrome/quinol oxidase subunit 3